MARWTTGRGAANKWRGVVINQCLSVTVSAEHDAAETMYGDWIDRVKLLSAIQAASCFT